MKTPHLLLVIISFLLLVTACIPPIPQLPPTAAALQDFPLLYFPTADPTPTTQPKITMTAESTENADLPTIVLPLSVYIIDGGENSLNSDREETEIRQIIARVNEIWTPANIHIELQTVQRLTLPSDVLASLMRGDFTPFFAGVETEFEVPDPSLVNGFYTRQIGGPNGIVPFNSRVFFIADEPSVPDERVTAHEIGHILGLHHVLDDPDRLMFSGTDGLNLSQEEIVVARYAVQGLLNRVR